MTHAAARSINHASCAAHRKKTKFHCDVCGKRLNSNKDTHGIETYAAVTHLMMKSFTCFLCGKSFFKSSALEEHENVVHLNETPFKCDACDKEFANRAMLKMHFFSIHERLFRCRYCKMTFISTDNGTNHVQKFHKGQYS